MKRSPLLMFQMWTCSFSAMLAASSRSSSMAQEPFVVELAVRDAGAVDLGLEQGSEHGF
jgi:hypothetical protein